MKILNFNQSEADVQFTIDEIIILKNAFNEVFNGIKIINFESEIGVSREEFKVLFQLVKYLLKDKSLIREKQLTSYKVDNSHHKYGKKSNKNFILKEKLCLKTEGYQVIFYLKNLDDCKNYVGVVIVLILSNISEFSIKTTAQSICIEDLQSLITYFEKHINSLKEKSSTDLSTFFNYQNFFQIQALSGNLILEEDEGTFPLRFMINVSYQDNKGSTSIFVDAEALVTLKNIQSFISSLQAALDKICHLD